MADIIQSYNQPTSVMSKGLWQVKICGMPTGTNLVTYLRNNISRATLFNYWVNTKKRIFEEQVDKIDWDVQGKEMRNNKYSRQQWVPKFISGWCVTGEMMKVWGQRLTSACPRCNTAVEDNNYILVCQAEGTILE